MMPNWPVFKKGTQFARAFWNDTSGVILPYVTVMLVVIVGLSVLALDGARLMSLQTQLQNGADALALAGAAELDRLPDAETRARTAIERLLTNSTLFGSGASRTIAVSNIKFYSRLPASDASPMSAGRLATGPANARFVSVTVRPVTLPTILPAAFFGGANMVTTAASAVAGFDQVVCGVTPIYVCNPYETAGMTYDQATEVLQHAAANPTDQGRLIRLRQYGGNAPYAAARLWVPQFADLGQRRDEPDQFHRRRRDQRRASCSGASISGRAWCDPCARASMCVSTSTKGR